MAATKQLQNTFFLQVRGLVLNDNNVVNTKGEVKWFNLDFESVGAGTCVKMDFGDGIIEAYGDQSYCNDWAPDVPYVPGVEIENPTFISHVYQ